MLGKAHTNPIVPVTDLPRARTFYEGILELTPLDVVPRYGVLTYQIDGGALFDIYLRETPTSGDHTAANFYVEDLDGLADRLIERGVTIPRYELPPDSPQTIDERGVICENGMPVVFFITDPDGNWLSFSIFRQDIKDALGIA